MTESSRDRDDSRNGPPAEPRQSALEDTDQSTALQRLVEEQAALRRIATLVARDVSSSEIFSAVSEEVSSLFDSAAAGVSRFERDAGVVWVGAANVDVPLGERWELVDGMASAEVYATGRPA